MFIERLQTVIPTPHDNHLHAHLAQYHSPSEPQHDRSAFLRILLRDAVLTGDDDRRRHAAEEAVLDDTAGVLELLRRLWRVLDRLFEEEVDDVVAVVGDGDRVAVDLRAGGDRAHPQLRLAALERRQRRHLAQRVLVAERRDLDGQREAGAEAVAQLRLVDDADDRRN